MDIKDIIIFVSIVVKFTVVLQQHSLNQGPRDINHGAKEQLNKKVAVSTTNPKFRPNAVPNCVEDLFFLFFFLSFIEFGKKSSNCGRDLFFGLQLILCTDGKYCCQAGGTGVESLWKGATNHLRLRTLV